MAQSPLTRRKVKIVRPEAIPEDETWAKINGFPELLAQGLTERQFQELCEDVASRYGWTVYHETDSRRSPKGLPDLIMLSPELITGGIVVAMLELKTEKGKVTAEQGVWLGKLARADTLVTGLLRPSDWRRFAQLCFDPAHLQEDREDGDAPEGGRVGDPASP